MVMVHHFGDQKSSQAESYNYYVIIWNSSVVLAFSGRPARELFNVTRSLPRKPKIAVNMTRAHRTEVAQIRYYAYLQGACSAFRVTILDV